MIRAALLDIDGTLVCSNEQHARSWSRAFNEHGYDLPAAAMRRLVGMGADKILPRVDAALSPDTEPELRSFDDRIRSSTMSTWPVCARRPGPAIF